MGSTTKPEYPPISGESHWEEGREKGRLAWAAVLSLVAIVIGGSGPRIVPGGPFISVVFDVLPFFMSLFAIYQGLRCLRSRQLWVQMTALIFVLIATLAIGKILVSVVAFWMRPYARGDLIGL